MNVTERLRIYVENNIYPLYDNNYIGDGKDRIQYVIDRSEQIIKENKLDVNDDMLYVVISYHDLRKNNDEKYHEITSAEIMFNDEFLKSFFTEEQRIIIKEAIEDQRANAEKEPRNIYGKILSSASRNSSVKQCLERSYFYGKKKDPKATDEELYNRAYEALLNKFGENGYAKFYFKDSIYEQFLEDIRKLLANKENFIAAQKSFIEKLNDK